MIRQFRPAVCQFTWELPAGIVDDGETPDEACIRELREETGLHPSSVRHCGSYLSDSGRIDNRIHVFSVQAGNPDKSFACEPGTQVAFWSKAEILRATIDGRFNHLLHVAAVLRVLTELEGPQ